MPQGIDKRDEKIWDKAIDAFKKQYKKSPSNDRDYAIVSDIFDKMGGRFDHSEFTGLIEQFKEGMIMTKLDKLYESVCKEAKWIDYKIIKKCFLGEVGDHVIIDYDRESPIWKNLTKGTMGSPVSTDEEKCLKKI
jgi:hypothetical protein